MFACVSVCSHVCRAQGSLLRVSTPQTECFTEPIACHVIRQLASES